MIINNKKVDSLYGGDIIVLINSHTFSSGYLFAEILSNLKQVTIVGSPAGQGGNSQFGDLLMYELPHSHAQVYLSHKEFIMPKTYPEHIDALYPDILIERTREDVLSDEDQILKKLLEKLG
ncbi:S41 family peptidase [Alkalihalobacillus trypoxylicola]|nr:S41 family peptidase [Alkalihalobacillus trypoxylicola]